MKAIFTFFFLTFCSIISAFPQATDSLQSSKFQASATVGVKGGVNISSLKNFNDNDLIIGLVLGFTGEYRFSELLGVAAELNYSQHGTNIQYMKQDRSGFTLQNIEYGLNYLTLPVLISLHDNGFTVQAGAYGAVLLKANARNGKITEDITEHFAPYESGLCLGLAYHFWGHTVLGLRYYRGLQNVNKSIPDMRQALRNSTLQVTGGYTF